LWNADFVRHSIRTRRRPRRCFSAFDFEDEDDDKDDDNTLHKANFNPRLDYGFFVLKCSFIYDDLARAPPTPGLLNGSQRADAGRRLAPESDTTDQTVYDSLELLTGTDLKWFRNQGLIFRLKNL